MTGGHLPQATNPKTGGHRPEKRPLRQVTSQVLLNMAGVFTHTLALSFGVLVVVLRGCGANSHGGVPGLVWYLAWCSVVSGPRSLLPSSPFSLSPSHRSVTTHTQCKALEHRLCQC